MPVPLTPDHRAWRRKILVTTYTAYAGYYLTRKVFTIAKKPIADSFGWELGSMAHIWTAFLVAYMIGQFVTSYLGRNMGSRVLLLGGFGLSILCNIIFGFANSYATFVVFMFFNGLVQATGWPGVVGGVQHWLRPHERGTIMGFWATSYVVGNMIVKSLGGLLLGVWGWQWSFFGCTLVSFGIWWMMYFWLRDKPGDVGLAPLLKEGAEAGQAVAASQEDRVTFKEYLEILCHPVVLIMGTSYFCLKFLRYALDSWLPAFLDIGGLDASQASYYSQIFDFAGLAGAVTAGWLLDRVFQGNWAKLSFLMTLGMSILLSIFMFITMLRMGKLRREQALAKGAASP